MKDKNSWLLVISVLIFAVLMIVNQFIVTLPKPLFIVFMAIALALDIIYFLRINKKEKNKTKSEDTDNNF